MSESPLKIFMQHLEDEADRLQTLQDLAMDEVNEAELRGAEQALRAMLGFLQDLTE